MDMYFTWYPFSEPKKIRFTVMKLMVRPELDQCETLQASRAQQPTETWVVIKGKYVPPS